MTTTHLSRDAAPQSQPPSDLRGRIALLVATVVISISVGGGYAWYALQRVAGDGSVGASDTGSNSVLAQPHVVFRNTTAGAMHGTTAAVALSAPRGPRTITTTSCERVYSVGATGLCLVAERGVVTTYKARFLDADLLPVREVATHGEPSRVRVSPDGRLAATTSFEAGHSYLESSFSTTTVIYDVDKGKALHNLEEFAIERAGRPYRNVDVNFWGVTFKSDGDGFFATLATQGKTYLVEGSIRKKTVRTLKENVECPSLSPDGTKIAYKSRYDVDGFSGWRVHILDLASGADRQLPTERSIDDQVEWLDDDRVMYGLLRRVGYVETDVWVVPADGSAAPSVFIAEAASPAVVRDPGR